VFVRRYGTKLNRTESKSSFSEKQQNNLQSPLTWIVY